MEESSEFGKSDLVGPRDLLINGIQIKAVPHLDFIDSVCRNIIDACRPVEFVVPVPSLLFAPSALNDYEQTKQEESERYFFHKFKFINLTDLSQSIIMIIIFCFRWLMIRVSKLGFLLFKEETNQSNGFTMSS
jgi:hypothetical protein